MVVLVEDIMLKIELHKRFYNQVFIGLLFLKMQGSLFYLMMNVKELVIFLGDFYFRALGSLVVLSFPQPLSFFSVLPKPLSETLTRSSDRRISV
jgi:hypothetical protein